MNTKLTILVFVFMIAISIVNAQTQQFPPDATIKYIDTTFQGTPTYPKIFTGSNIFQLDTTDIRIRPTNNSQQSEMSIAISPMDNNILLVSANTANYPATTTYGTGYYISTDGGFAWNGNDQPPTGNLNRGDPAAVIDYNGYFYIGSIALNYGQGIMRSTNSGISWNYIPVANPAIPDDKNYILDKNHLTVDNRTFGLNSGNLYSAWSDFYYPDRRITVARSTNQGEIL